ncbi:RNA-binding domain-containing protein [Nocardioides sp.]|uniref:RNA-binding domain-containing protein n=1 Tax=Nocardioides sp. TaxID=35761 RepID=UPI0037841D0C
MYFTALHQALGRDRSHITDELVDEAVDAGVAESDHLDWKSALPPEKELKNSDFPKDVAAMANSGGGVIVYGVEEQQRVATERVDAGDFGENYERTLRKVASSSIQPPVLGLGVHQVGDPMCRALVVVVPLSVDGPHLIWKNDAFLAPYRNHADTEWMGERQLEAAYRARFDERRTAEHALVNLYDEISAGPASSDRAWMYGVARPRLTATYERMGRGEARKILQNARQHAPAHCATGGVHPLESMDLHNPRPGLRRWVAPSDVAHDSAEVWKSAWATVHDDGSISLASAMGATRGVNSSDPAWQVLSRRLEYSIGDFMALLRQASTHFGGGDYDVRVGIEWAGALLQPLVIAATDSSGYPTTDRSIPLYRYSPVVTTVRTDVDFDGFQEQVWTLAQDVVNQGGVEDLVAIHPPATSE